MSKENPVPPYDVDRLKAFAKKMLLARGEIPTAEKIFKLVIFLRKQELSAHYKGGKNGPETSGT
jgi:hypothetical protein